MLADDSPCPDEHGDQEREAENQINRALGLAELDGDLTLKERIARSRDELRFVEVLDRLRVDKATNARGEWQSDAAKSYRVYFLTLGYDFEAASTPERREPLVARLKADPINEFLLLALDDWLPAEPDEDTAAHLATVTATVTGQAWRNQFRGARETAFLVYGGDLELPWAEMSAPMVASLCTTMSTIAPGSRAWAVARMEEAVARRPADFALRLSVGLRLQRLGKTAPAAEHFRQAALLRPESPVVKELEKLVVSQFAL